MQRSAADPVVADLAAAMELRAATSARPDPVCPERTRRRVLVLGLNRDDRPMACPPLLGEPDLVVHAELSHVDAALIRRFQPELVVSTLIARNWDILDLAEHLSRAGYAGSVLVVSRPLPHAGLVIDEIEALFPGLSLTFAERAP